MKKASEPLIYSKTATFSNHHAAVVRCVAVLYYIIQVFNKNLKNNFSSNLNGASNTHLPADNSSALNLSIAAANKSHLSSKNQANHLINFLPELAESLLLKLNPLS